MKKLSRLEKILIPILSISILTTFLLARSNAEQGGGSPESGVDSILMDTYNELVTLGYGSESGSLGTIWNRIYNASTWVPDGSLTESDVIEGKTFYDGNRTLKTGTLSEDAVISCPTGMIFVPAGDNGVSFCVDKYENKNVGGVATSQATGTTWVNINRYQAKAACEAVGKHLITEREWMQIAHNVEEVGWNWSGETPDSGDMSDGHSDGTPGGPIEAGSDDNPCYATGQTCDEDTWHTQRRTYKLSTGEYIWDFAGNVWEWTSDLVYNDEPYANDWSGWVDCTTPDDICGNTYATNDQRYGANTTDVKGILRGGAWQNNVVSGAFSAHLYRSPSLGIESMTFRCAL